WATPPSLIQQRPGQSLRNYHNHDKKKPPSGDHAANLIAFCRSKTVSKAVHAPPADGPGRKAGTVCVGVNLISADGAPGVTVAVSVRAYRLVADRTRRPAGAVAISADVLTADPACRIAVPISVGVYGAIAVYTCRITRSIRVKDGALGVQRRNGCREHQRYKTEALHRTPPRMDGSTDAPKPTDAGLQGPYMAPPGGAPSGSYAKPCRGPSRTRCIGGRSCNDWYRGIPADKPRKRGRLDSH